MQRTTQQNSALHIYFRKLATKLNEAGLDQRKVLKPSVAIPWDEKSVKERLWKGIQRVKTGKDKTSSLDKKEVSEIYEILNRHLVQTFGDDAHIPFPSEEERYYE
jgi:hypothetical protein